MDTFKVYYEKFSWNPRTWFQSPEAKRQLAEEERMARTETRAKYQTSIKKLKDLLKQKGFIIHKHDYSYAVFKDKKIGISPKESSREKLKYKDPISDIPYIRTLFVLAHEVGHILQYDDPLHNARYRAFVAEEDAISEYYDNLDLKNLHKLWYELDAWRKGMEFIPIEYLPQYKKYAFQAYKTYMDYYPGNYARLPLLRNLLEVLNLSDQLK